MSRYLWFSVYLLSNQTMYIVTDYTRIASNQGFLLYVRQVKGKTLWVCLATDLQGQFLRWDIIRLVGKFASFEDILICPTTKTVMGQTSLSSQGVNPTASK